MVQDVHFAVTAVPYGSDRLLRVTGELDIATAPLLGAAMDEALACAPELLLVDLSQTVFIDSTGCRELMIAAKTGQVAGVRVEVVVPPDNWRVRRVVDFVQLAGLVPVHDAPPARP